MELPPTQLPPTTSPPTTTDNTTLPGTTMEPPTTVVPPTTSNPPPTTAPPTTEAPPSTPPPTTQPPTTQPPTTPPPTTQPPTTELPPTTQPPPTTVPPPTTLPPPTTRDPPTTLPNVPTTPVTTPYTTSYITTVSVITITTVVPQTTVIHGTVTTILATSSFVTSVPTVIQDPQQPPAPVTSLTSGNSNGIQSWQVVLAVIGGIVGLSVVVIAFLVFWARRRHQANKTLMFPKLDIWQNPKNNKNNENVGVAQYAVRASGQTSDAGAMSAAGVADAGRVTGFGGETGYHGYDDDGESAGMMMTGPGRGEGQYSPVHHARYGSYQQQQQQQQLMMLMPDEYSIGDNYYDGQTTAYANAASRMPAYEMDMLTPSDITPVSASPSAAPATTTPEASGGGLEGQWQHLGTTTYHPPPTADGQWQLPIHISYPLPPGSVSEDFVSLPSRASPHQPNQPLTQQLLSPQSPQSFDNQFWEEGYRHSGAFENRAGTGGGIGLDEAMSESGGGRTMYDPAMSSRRTSHDNIMTRKASAGSSAADAAGTATLTTAATATAAGVGGSGAQHSREDRVGSGSGGCDLAPRPEGGGSYEYIVPLTQQGEANSKVELQRKGPQALIPY